MEVFSAVVSAIDLTERIWKLIDNFQKVPERLRRLQVDIKLLQQTLEKLKDTDFRRKGKENLLEAEIHEIQTTLLSLQQRISQHHPKAGSGVLSRSLRTFRTQMKFDDLDELATELQKRKSSLSLAIDTLVLGAFIENTMSSGTAKVQNAGSKTVFPVVHLSQKEFLDTLSAPNYAEDELRVNSPTDGTALWIYDRPEYKEWFKSEESASLHLVGKMGSGKSVLMKGITKNLKKTSLGPNSKGLSVLYYFCSCVNRIDNSSNILKGFISQLVLEHEGIYEASLGRSELLQSRRTGDSPGWSFEALWHMFTKLVQGSGVSNLYCVIDALDECDPESLNGLLNLLHRLPKDSSMAAISVKLLFSTREYTHTLNYLDRSGESTRLLILPETVMSDIRAAMQSDINHIQKRLKLLDDEVVTLQEAILQKSDGMFLWVSLATKNIIDNSYDATYEMLEELIENLPAGLRGLYEKNWVKLIESLPTTNLALANKVLTWVLLAERPLTISELTIALAIEPGQKRLPSSKKLLRNLSAFVLKYLTPFVEIIPTNESIEQEYSACTKEPIPAYKAGDNSKVRIVHQSAQEYLLEACNDKTNSISKFKINLRDGHESLARICIAYLCSDELQLGWIDEENKNKSGLNNTTDLTRQKVKERLNTYPFLDYASFSWPFHVRKCQYLPRPGENQDRLQKDDIFQQTINFLKRFRQGYACSAQIRQLLLDWEADCHYGPAPPIHCAAARHLSVIVRRLLKEPGLDLDLRDSEGCTVLHYAASAEDSSDHPEERLEIMDMVLKAGVNIDAVTKAGETSLHHACSYPLPSVATYLVENGIDVNIRDENGITALNQKEAVASKEIIECLLDAGADIETKDVNGSTPLLKASQVHSWEAICILVERGANCNAQTTDGWACLHYVIEEGNNALIKFLLQKGADINIKTITNWSTIHCAAIFDHLDSYKILVENGADTSATNDSGWNVFLVAVERGSVEFVQHLLDTQIDMNVTTKEKHTPLHLSARRNDIMLTQLLLEKGADTKAQDFRGFTPLHHAITCGNHEIAGYLLKLHVKNIDNSLDRALHIACSKPDTELELIEKLLELGASPNAEDLYKMAPLHIAADKGFTKAIDILLKYGADIEKVGQLHLRPLIMAAKAGHLETTKFLVEKGADINEGPMPSIGHNALGLSCLKGQIEVVKWLLDNGADASVSFRHITMDSALGPSHNEIFRLLLQKREDVNAEDPYGITAIFAAVKYNKLGLVKFLLEIGADVMRIDANSGDSIFHAAAFLGNKEILQMLTEKADLSFTKYLNARSQTPGVVAAISGQLAALGHLASIGPAETLRITSPFDIGQILRFEDYAAILDSLSKHRALDTILSQDFLVGTVLFRICAGIDFIPHDLDAVLGTLIKHGFKLDVVNVCGQTILHSIVISCIPKIAKLLLAHGSNFRLRDKHGFNTFDHLLYGVSKCWFSPRQPPRPLPPYFPRYKPNRPLMGIPATQESPKIPQSTAPPVSSGSSHPSLVSSSASTTSSTVGALGPPAPPPPPSNFTRMKPSDVATDALLYDKDGNILTDDTGGTILHAAASNGNKEIIEAVLEKKPQIISDSNGWLPSMVAERSGFPDLAELLSKAEETERKATTSALKWSSKLKSVNLVLDRDFQIKLPDTIDCGIKKMTTLEGIHIRFVNRAFSIMSDAPVPYEVTEYYFEVELLEDSLEPGGTAVGFACLPQPLEQTLPGWHGHPHLRGQEISSWGYHSDNGRRYPGHAAPSEPYGEQWVVGDTVGCGIDVKEKRIWFVKNGKFQGFAFNNVKGQLYPIIGFSGGGIRVRGKLGVKPPQGWRDQIFVERPKVEMMGSKTNGRGSPSDSGEEERLDEKDLGKVVEGPDLDSEGRD
ncbi:ankyrin repeat-containing domain protein [Bisporella sp. PMI_857]|nr:ankyrin repeat-containing domain protein [Bisporella sp. PMI_857]